MSDEEAWRVSKELTERHQRRMREQAREASQRERKPHRREDDPDAIPNAPRLTVDANSGLPDTGHATSKRSQLPAAEFHAQYLAEQQHRTWEEKERESSTWWALLSLANLALSGLGIVFGGILTVRRFNEDSALSGLFVVAITGAVCVLAARSALRELLKDTHNFNSPDWHTGSDHTNVIGTLFVLLLFNGTMATAIWPSNNPSVWADAPPEVEYDRRRY